MSTLLLIIVVIWLGFLASVVAFLKSRPGRKAKNQNQGHDDPFLAATSGPVNGDHGSGADDALRQLDDAARNRQRSALWQNLAGKAPRSIFGFTLVLLGLLAAHLTGYFKGGWERRVVSGAALGQNKIGLSLGRKYFYARAGQTVDVNYSYTTGSGRLYVAVMRNATLFNTPSLDKPPLWSQTVQVQGAWKTTVPIPENGSYRVYIAAWPSRGASLTYDVSWKVH